MSALNRGELTRKQAEKQILALLDRVPDSQLPKPDRIEKSHDDNDFAWYGSMGYGIRPITTSPAGQDMLRRAAVSNIFHEEWVRREQVRRFGEGFQFKDGQQVGA